MSAGARFEYHWQDGVNFKKPTKVSAPEYVDYLMDWVQKQLDDEQVFPSQIGERANPHIPPHADRAVR